MRALDKLANFRAKTPEFFRRKILGNCNGKLNSSFWSSNFKDQGVSKKIRVKEEEKLINFLKMLEILLGLASIWLFLGIVPVFFYPYLPIFANYYDFNVHEMESAIVEAWMACYRGLKVFVGAIVGFCFLEITIWICRRWTNWLRFDGIRKKFKNDMLFILFSKITSLIWNKSPIYCL